MNKFLGFCLIVVMVMPLVILAGCLFALAWNVVMVPTFDNVHQLNWIQGAIAVVFLGVLRGDVKVTRKS